MSWLSKIFIILVFLIAVANAAIIVTLYAQRTDWHDKYVKEVNTHYADIQLLKAEAEAKQVIIDNYRIELAAKDTMINQRDSDIAAKSALLEQANATIADYKVKFERLLANMEALSRNLEVMIARVADLSNENTALRENLDQARAALSQLNVEVINAKGELDSKERSLATTEDELIKASRELTRLQGVVNELKRQGLKVDVIPVPQLTAVVRGVAMDVGLVVLSVGKEEGVTPGMKFTIYRGSDFVCAVMVDKVEARWSSARIATRRMDPRVGDSATNAGSLGGLAPGNP